MDLFHATGCSDPTLQITPWAGSVIWAMTTMSSLRLMVAASTIGDAVVEEARPRAKRRAVKSCIAGVAERTTKAIQVWCDGRNEDEGELGGMKSSDECKFEVFLCGVGIAQKGLPH